MSVPAGDRYGAHRPAEDPADDDALPLVHSERKMVPAHVRVREHRGVGLAGEELGDQRGDGVVELAAAKGDAENPTPARRGLGVRLETHDGELLGVGAERSDRHWSQGSGTAEQDEGRCADDVDAP